MLQFISGIIRSFILLCMLYTHSICANLIYVYLSAQLPAYIHIALEQARLFNPNTDIYLIANQEAINKCKDSLANSGIIIVAAESLKPSVYHQMFDRNSTLNTSTLDGLWRKSSERFFYIHELMILHDLNSVVHVESDNMLYVDIQEIQGAFSHYQGISAVFDSDNRCIPSVVYIANQKAMTHLIQFIAEHAPKGLTDMYIIALYRNTYSREYIDNLPLIMPEYQATHALMNALNQKPQNPSAYYTYIQLFNSIFDAAAIGQYLGGTAPIHGAPKPGFINETCIFNPSFLTLEWQTDFAGRKIPFASCGGKKYRINNLHIHSKMLEHFKS